MKKSILPLFIIIVLCFSTGCGKSNQSVGMAAGAPTKLMTSIYRYQSVDELCSDLATAFDEQALEEIEVAESMGGQEVGTFRRFLTDRQAKNRLLVPYFKEEIIPFRYKEESENITIHALAGIISPPIWYYGAIDNEKILIITRYLNDDETEAVDGKSASWYLRKHYPGVRNVGKCKFFSKKFKGVYEKELKLKERTVKALVNKYKNDTEISLRFIYDEMFVYISYDPKKISDEVFEDISFVEHSIK
jgi:hypothetical protein